MNNTEKHMVRDMIEDLKQSIVSLSEAEPLKALKRTMNTLEEMLRVSEDEEN